MSYCFNIPEKYARLTKQQAINVGQWVYYDSKYKCIHGHRFWRIVCGYSGCYRCSYISSKKRRIEQRYGIDDELPHRKKVDDALFEKKMQKMIDQDYLD